LKPTYRRARSLARTTCFAAFLSLVAVVPPAARAGNVVTTIDSAGVVGFTLSMQLNAGKPVVSYRDFTNGTLKLATCTAGCDTTAPTWVYVVVEGGGSGPHSSLQLNGGNPVVSYSTLFTTDLKLATCTANCATAAPTWQIVTVDSAGATGFFTSMQLNGGNPVIAYHDNTSRDLKLATCTAGCATAAPTWQIVTVDSAGDTGRTPSLQLNGGNPVISYVNLDSGELKLATCTAGCATAAPTWQIVKIDDAYTGLPSASLQLDGGNPVVSYAGTGGALKLATCTAGCATATPTWRIVTVDAGGGLHNSLQLDAGRPVASYFAAGSVRIATCTAGCATATPTWTYATADSGSANFPYQSLRLDGSTPVVAYQDESLGDLKLSWVGIVPPSASAITRSGPNPSNSAAVDFAVTFSEAVTGVDPTDFALATTGTLAGATIGGVAGSGTAWTVTVNTGTGSGTLRLDLADDDTITNGTLPLGGAGAGNGGFAAGEVYAIDRAGPVTASVSAPAAGSYSAGQALGFTVTFDEPVAVDTSGGVPTLALTIGAAARAAAYVAGSGTNALLFSYTVQPGDIDLDGIALGGAIVPGGGTLADALGNGANVALNGAASTAAVLVTAAIVSHTAPSATGSGAIAASFSGGGPGCTFTTAQFIPVAGHPRSPPAGSAPQGVSFPHGLFDFTTSGCTPGSTITMAVTYPQPLPAGMQYWKYGPTPTDPVPHWYVLPATIAGATATFTITDGGLGDDDLAPNGTIVDQGGPGGPSGVAPVPTLSEWAMLLLASLMLLAGMAEGRRRT